MDPTKIKVAAERFASFMRGAADAAPHVASMAAVTDAIAKGKLNAGAVLRGIGESVEVDAAITVAGVPLRVNIGGRRDKP